MTYRILISGGAGFIGSNTIELLEKAGNKILALDNLSTGLSDNLKTFRGFFELADITNVESIERAFAEFQPHAVLHLAAQSAISIALADPQKDLRVNAIGTLNVLEMAKKYNVKRFVFASTSAVYRESRKFWQMGMTENWPAEPSNPYGISKLACEGYVRTMFPNHMILRYANIYGPKQRSIGENQVVARAFAHFVKGADFKIVGSGNQKRDFVYVGDIALCNQAALLSGVVGTFNAASGKSYSVNQVLSEIEKVYEVPGYHWENTSQEDPRGSVYLSNKSIRKNLGWWADHGISEGIRRTYEWWKSCEKKTL